MTPDQAMPTCHICQGQMSRGLYEAAEWTCMRCWGMWLAGAPGALRCESGECETRAVEYRPPQMDWDFEPQAPKDPGSFEITSVTFEPKPGELRWDDV